MGGGGEEGRRREGEIKGKMVLEEERMGAEVLVEISMERYERKESQPSEEEYFGDGDSESKRDEEKE